MTITIVDYGLSNLLSVRRAVEKLGCTAAFARTAQEVREARALILPGVGAFSNGMAGLMERDMLQPIWGCAESGVPILGICLGMQMLFESGREHGPHRGLGLLPGHVERIPNADAGGAGLPVPHIGWAGLLPPDDGQKRFHSELLHHVHPEEEVYFVHSFAARPRHAGHVAAECEYGGHRLCAAVSKNNIYGTQFHPEKSGPVGLKILRAFLQKAQELRTL